MKTVSLSGSLRENVGKKDAKMQRYAAKVPCVLYGGKEQVHFSTDAVNFKAILFTPETFLIKITIGDKSYDAILKDVQYHPVEDNVLHADFYQVEADKPVVVSLPVKVAGTSPGVIRGGKLKVKLSRLKVKGLIAKIPEFIEINISKLNVGQGVKVKDLSFENLTILELPNNVVLDVKVARGITLADEEPAEENA
ncbi:MAG: 50S ribosomal protein L25/general stress protein Ctc [Bacteroidales bacterium]|nr:50S ribosomal protein L25/general stress protein Ctc [Bacteroidales bacterium]